ncbi:hypothetical protein C9374_009419 [Naegleria lovaniensis]|uniref:Protein kinase domain-containing protein n=1 Tax=Naegleria lovaniensis TaxID=51637 RepID=A0AA88KR11_NAELO|nr:uncharacterized protein C9374_009419 [Naegleria lovaniensis]KAG2392842.1 hypothetical protein C9374_009419 [Naegleria lovaniensis]
MFKVLAKLESEQSELKVLLKLSNETTFDSLSQQLQTHFFPHATSPNNNNRSLTFDISFLHVRDDQPMQIQNNDHVKEFIQQISQTTNGVNKKEYKILTCKVRREERVVSDDDDDRNDKIENVDHVQPYDSRLASDSFVIRGDDDNARKVVTLKTMDDEGFDSRLATDSFLINDDKKDRAPIKIDEEKLDSRFANLSFEMLNTSANKENVEHNPFSSDQEESTTSTLSELERVQKMLDSQYEQLTFLASGGFGTVYSAIRKGNQKKVAIKIMKTENEWKLANSALKEFEKMVKLYHEHIVKTYRAFFVGALSSIGIEMELMCGSLMDFIQKKQVLNEKVLLKILKQCCQALEWIEKNHNVVHRDIKPQNILTRSVDLNENEINVALADFGLARTVESVNVTQFGGTNNYFSPEVISNQTFSFASDVFALGVTIYQLMSFDMTTVWSTNILNTNYKSLQQFIRDRSQSPTYSDFLLDLIISMLKFTPSERITVSQILERISQYEQVGTKILILSLSTAEQDFEHGNQCLARGDTTQALEYFTKSANEGYVAAQHALGDLYNYKDRVMLPDYSLAKSWYEKAAEQGHASSQYELAYMYEYGVKNHDQETIVEINPFKALEYYEQAASNGSDQAQLRLAQLYASGEGGLLQDYNKSFEFMKKAAEQGNTAAQAMLGMMYHSGRGCERDLAMGCEWIEKAAQKNDSLAQHLLGVAYRFGEGVPQDYSKSIEYFEKSAAQGNHGSQYELGFAYQNGIGVIPDMVKAVEWYEKAATENPLAQYALGLIYRDGYRDLIPADLPKCCEYFLKAANQGHALAQHELGIMYSFGAGVPKDDSKTLEWFEKAANAGYANSQYMLGLIYENGRHGVQPDVMKAFQWYQQAAFQGHFSANESLQQLFMKLNGNFGMPLN